MRVLITVVVILVLFIVAVTLPAALLLLQGGRRTGADPPNKRLQDDLTRALRSLGFRREEAAEVARLTLSKHPTEDTLERLIPLALRKGR